MENLEGSCRDDGGFDRSMGCHKTEYLQPPKPKDEYKQPPTDDPRFTNPPKYPNKLLNQDGQSRPGCFGRAWTRARVGTAAAQAPGGGSH